MSDKITVLITEKPSVAQEYKKVLQIHADEKTDGYVEGYSPVLNTNMVITWAVGHLIGIGTVDEQIEQRQIKASEHYKAKWTRERLPIIPQKFLYFPNGNTEKQFKVIKSIYTRKNIERLYYAGDSGREGIYIQALIRNQIFSEDPKFDERVVWIDSYTEEEILRGIREAKPYHDYDNMIASGYSRAISDWLIGMNFTQAFTLTSSSLVSVGRVMTPTLAMIVQRQKEIDEFVPTDSYGVVSAFDSKWKADKNSRFFESPLLYDDVSFKAKFDVEALILDLSKDKHLKVENVEITEKKEYAPYLFNLVDLQAHCSKTLGISPSQTLNIAQSLYEKKLITYPRTDARVLSSAVAKTYKGIPNRYVNDAQITDHYAIIPTRVKGNVTGLEGKVYDAIQKRFQAIFMPPYVYNSISVTLVHQNGEHFYASDTEMVDLGWKELYDNLEDHKTSDFKKLTVGSVVDASFKEKNYTTKPPVPYTQGSIIVAMEKAGKQIEDKDLALLLKGSGIGTSATRAGILDKLIDKGFVSVKGKVLIPTESGKQVVELVKKYDEALISPIKTAEMEQKLSDIVDGSVNQSTYLQEVNKYIVDTTKKILETNQTQITGVAIPCPCCKNNMKNGRYGLYCDCGFSISKEICKAKISPRNVDSIIKTGRSNKIDSFISKNGKKFSAYLVVNKESRSLEFSFEKV